MNRRDFMRNVAVISGVSLVGGFPLSAVSKSSIKFDSYVSNSAGPSFIDEWFLNELEQRTNGEVNVRRFWSSSLSKVGEHLGAVRDGTSEITLISPGYYQSELPMTRGLEWYYRMTRADALQLVCRDLYQQFEPLRIEWEERHRSKVLYWTNWNYAPLILRDPINSISDIKGKKIRGYGVAVDVIERLGGIAVPMAAPEVYQALERGVLDGVYGFDFVTAVAYKLHEAAPNFYDIGDGPHAPSALVMNMDAFNGLSDHAQSVMMQLTDEIYGGKFGEIYEGVLESFVKKLYADGGVMLTLSDEEKAHIKSLVQPSQVENWIDSVAEPAGVDGHKMQELIDKAINKYDSKGTLKTPYEIAQEL